VPGTVVVCCKLPSGLHLDLMKTSADGKPTNILARRVTVNGTQAQRALERADDKGRPVDMEPFPGAATGFGLTFGVDADFWEAWVNQNKDYTPYARGMIFAHAKVENARAEAKEKGDKKAGIKSGLEPIDPENPGGKIKPDERHKSAA
jgi:hypothetical protein